MSSRRGVVAGARRLAHAAAVALVVIACQPAEGPQPIAYDRQSCAHCHMLISEPRFAAQLHTEDGAVESFDDPGCLLEAIDVGSPAVRALWFHHVREDRWLDGAHVAFEDAGQTPMGYGLGAVDAGTAGAVSLDEARARVTARRAQPESRR